MVKLKIYNDNDLTVREFETTLEKIEQYGNNSIIIKSNDLQHTLSIIQIIRSTVNIDFTLSHTTCFGDYTEAIITTFEGYIQIVKK